jgi:hypothetical protein
VRANQLICLLIDGDNVECSYYCGKGEGVGRIDMAAVGKGRGVIEFSFPPRPALVCCNADLGGLLQSRGRDSSRNAVVVVIYTLNLSFPLKKCLTKQQQKSVSLFLGGSKYTQRTQILYQPSQCWSLVLVLCGSGGGVGVWCYSGVTVLPFLLRRGGCCLPVNSFKGPPHNPFLSS